MPLFAVNALRRRLSSSRRPRRPAVERLDDRCLLSATLGTLTQTDFQTLALDYQVTAPSSSQIMVEVFRSPDATFDRGSDVSIGSVALAGADVTPGAHADVPLLLSGERSPGVPALYPDPANPYVFAVVTNDDGDSTASFQKYVLGLVTHGFVPPTELGELPAWVPQMAGALEAEGYDHAIPFDWSNTAGILLPGLAVQAGKDAAMKVEQFLATPGNVPAGAVVDLHLIGHSRGSVVITQAMQTLQDDLAKIPQAAGGYWKLTYLDPHPAHDTNVVPFTVAPGTLGQVAQFLGDFVQISTQDPYPLMVPSQVAEAQIYSERTPNAQILETNPEWIINPQGAQLNGGFVPLGTNTTFHFQDLSAPGMTHSETHLWYSEFALPSVATANPFVTSPIVAPFLATGYDLNATAFEPLVKNAWIATIAVSDPSLSASDFTASIDWGDGDTSSGYVVGTALTGFAVLGEHVYTQAGSFHYSVSIRSTANPTTGVAKGTFDVVPLSLVAVPTNGPSVGLTRSDTGATVGAFQPFGSTARGAVRVVREDVNRDGIPDIITATGPGDPAMIRIFDGRTGGLIRQFAPFYPGFRGGVNIAAGDLDGDGKAEIIATPASGNVPLVKVFDGATGQPIRRFLASRQPGSSGIAIQVRDTNGDGLGDVVASPSTGAEQVIDGQGFVTDRANRTLLQTRQLRAAVLSGAIPLRQGLPLLGLTLGPAPTPSPTPAPASPFASLMAARRLRETGRA